MRRWVAIKANHRRQWDMAKGFGSIAIRSENNGHGVGFIKCLREGTKMLCKERKSKKSIIQSGGTGFK